jgi:hypothetical protein
MAVIRWKTSFPAACTTTSNWTSGHCYCPLVTLRRSKALTVPSFPNLDRSESSIFEHTTVCFVCLLYTQYGVIVFHFLLKWAPTQHVLKSFAINIGVKCTTPRLLGLARLGFELQTTSYMPAATKNVKLVVSPYLCTFTLI